jgi:hypothetical protein
MSEGQTTNYVTLQRGVDYKHYYNGEYHHFRRSIPKEVTDEGLIDELEMLYDQVSTSEGHVIDLDKFKIDRNVEKFDEEEEVAKTKRKRIRLVEEDVSALTLRKKPKFNRSSDAPKASPSKTVPARRAARIS